MKRNFLFAVLIILLFTYLIPYGSSQPVRPFENVNIPQEMKEKKSAFGLFNYSGLFNTSYQTLDMVPGEVIVKFKEKKFESAEKQLSRLQAKANIKRLGILSTKKVFNATKVNKGLSGVYKLKIPPNMSVKDAVNELKKDPDIEYAEPNYILKTFASPNDPDYPSQWFHQTVQSELAWNITTGSRDTIIAIVDTGVDWNHPDLVANIWNNTDEIPDNGQDDDGNGFIDDIRGYDFTDTNSSWCSDTDCITRDKDPMDFNGHGTHCSGIAGAVTNNSAGVAGMCWNCSIMPVRAGFDTIFGGSLEIDDAADAIIYAADNGADVISMSWGGSMNSSLIYDAIEYAYSQDVVLVAAAGNSYSSSPIYPAAYEKVIAVSATDPDNKRAYFTSYGNWVDVAAPGVDIMSTLYDDDYDEMSGTSMAAPMVAGLAGLILSRNSSFSNEEVRRILKSSADPVVSSIFMGFGRINSYRALQINSTGIANISSPLINSVINGTVSINGTSSSPDFKNYTLEYGEGLYPTIWTLINESDLQVIDGPLAEWNSNAVLDGLYTLRLVTNTNQGWSEDRVNVLVISDLYTCYSCADCEFKLDLGTKNLTLGRSINSSGDCISIYSSNSVFDCDGYSLNGIGNGYGIYVSYKNNVTIKNCHANNFSRGIYLTGSDYSRMINNSVSGSEYGLYLSYSSYDNLTFNNLSENQINLFVSGYSSYDFNHSIDQTNLVNGFGVIYVFNQSNTTIEDTNTGHITISYSNNVTVRNNTIISDPINLIEVTNSTIIENNISGNYYGIYLDDCSQNLISNNTFNDVSYGIEVYYSDFNNISNNTMSNVSVFGFDIHGYSSYYNYINQDNTVDGNSVYYFYNWHGNESNYINITGFNLNTSNVINLGLAMVNSSYLNVSSSNISYAENCLSLLYSDYNHLTENLLVGCNSTGITLEESNWNIISGNWIEDAYYGIDIYSSGNNSITNNNITGSEFSGINLFFDENNEISDNTIHTADYGMWVWSTNDTLKNNSIWNVSEYGFYMLEPYNYVDQDNTVGGNNVYYYYNLHGNETNIINVTGINLEGSYILFPGRLTFINSSFFNLNGNNISGADYGIVLYESENATVYNNILLNSSIVGLYLSYSGNNSILDNAISDSYYSLVIDSSDNNSVRNINITSNTYGAYIFFSDYNTIENLTSSSNEQDGILFDWSDRNKLSGSRFENNTKYGIHIGYYSNSNLIYNNYFNNVDNFFICPGTLNQWNTTKSQGENVIGGLYLGGNFWSNYNGSDTDGDRLGDTAYNLSNGNLDYYPLTYDITAPIFISASLFPLLILQNENITISSNITDFNLTAVWYNISNSTWSVKNYMQGSYGFFNSTYETISLEPGYYNMTIFANDSIGQESNTSVGTFKIANQRIINLSIFYFNGSFLNISRIKILYNRTNFIRNHSESNVASFFSFLPQGFWDIEVSTQNLNYTFTDVNISQNINGSISLDRLPPANVSSPVQHVSFVEILAAETSLNYSLVQIYFEYNASLLQNESKIIIYSCHNWSLQNRQCLGSWENITGNCSINTSNNTVIINTSSLSSFSLAEQLPYCGDGKVDPGENCANCQQDAGCSGGYTCNPSTYICEDEGNDGSDGGGLTTSIRIISYPSALITAPNSDKYFEIEVNNTGMKNLTYVTVSLSLNFSFNISVTPNNISLLSSNTQKFNISFTVPPNQSQGNYTMNITVNSNEGATHSVSLNLTIEEISFICNEGNTTQCGQSNIGRCKYGNRTCVNNIWGDCKGDVEPTNEICNGIDDNCNGVIDDNESCCKSGDTRPCGPNATIGECKEGTISCINGIFSNGCIGAVYPTDEICWDGKDNNCNNIIDDGCNATVCGEGEINQTCICDSSVRKTGYCCSGIYSEQECQQNTWWILSLTGGIILVVTCLVVIFIKGRRREKKLTWEDLEKKYTRINIWK